MQNDCTNLKLTLNFFFVMTMTNTGMGIMATRNSKSASSMRNTYGDCAQLSPVRRPICVGRRGEDECALWCDHIWLYM